jgi:hypothetical protein
MFMMESLSGASRGAPTKKVLTTTGVIFVSFLHHYSTPHVYNLFLLMGERKISLAKNKMQRMNPSLWQCNGYAL